MQFVLKEVYDCLEVWMFFLAELRFADKTNGARFVIEQEPGMCRVPQSCADSWDSQLKVTNYMQGFIGGAGEASLYSISLQTLSWHSNSSHPRHYCPLNETLTHVVGICIHEV
jgi:hypothetical protein